MNEDFEQFKDAVRKEYENEKFIDFPDFESILGAFCDERKRLNSFGQYEMSFLDVFDFGEYYTLEHRDNLTDDLDL